MKPGQILWQVVAPLVGLAAVAAGVAFALADYFIDPGPPIHVSRAFVLTETVPAGGTLRVQYSISRSRVCTSLIAGWMVDQRTQEAVIRFDPLFGGYSPLGADREVTVSRPVPAQPGRYCYKAAITHWCDQKTYTTTQPEACFDVVPTALQEVQP